MEYSESELLKKEVPISINENELQTVNKENSTNAIIEKTCAKEKTPMRKRKLSKDQPTILELKRQKKCVDKAVSIHVTISSKKLTNEISTNLTHLRLYFQFALFSIIQMIKYAYGFDKLNTQNMWIEESNNDEADNVNETNNDNFVPIRSYGIDANLDEDSLNQDSRFIDESDKENFTAENDLFEYHDVEILNSIEEDISHPDETSDEQIASPKRQRYCTNNILFNEKFFTVISSSEKGTEAKCSNCKKLLKGYGSSSSNFISHLKVVSIYYSMV